ncbi:hypothetical protein CRP01_11710 [Flavilitoribacter nigricans DSM 23189 = NBRC 102662]|uniref:Uncharacterized protein n=1 Tax=Flavilitoribacter nigricans (strain ATCC 23147 / DSM 23189 / NBRC 102662 / NCIMB 1420 / SS-2) TaxID=1122177 RepID=A0A2D0NDI0_FLAN2|nr:hypothetical protein CRP01_11710 [Flavilitoribacter nigricans DSM 23189 = NBRC 102662]
MVKKVKVNRAKIEDIFILPMVIRGILVPDEIPDSVWNALISDIVLFQVQRQHPSDAPSQNFIQ